MNTNNEAVLSMEEFHTQMMQQADCFAAVTALQNKLRFGRGMNQTLAMECENLRPGFITSSNPIAGFSVQPSKTNLSLTLEELDKVKIGLIAAAIAIGSAILWKIIKWFKKWRSGDSGDSGSSSSGDNGSGSGGHIPPARVGAVITGSIDVLNSLDEHKKELISACVKSGTISSIEASKKIEDMTIGAYKPLGDVCTLLFDNFINKTGTVEFLMKLHDGALKEAPTKLRDAFNKLEQLANTFKGSNDDAVRVDTLAKLTEMVTDSEKTKSFWYATEELGAGNVNDLTAVIRKDIEDDKGKPSNLGNELAGRMSNFTDKLRQGLHGTYEKLDVDVTRLSTELETDLRSKITSLEKQIKGTAEYSKKGDASTDLINEFADSFSKIIRMLNNDIASIGNLIVATTVISKDYIGVIKALPRRNQWLIKDLMALSKQYKATEVYTALSKLNLANDKLLKGR